MSGLEICFIWQKNISFLSQKYSPIVSKMFPTFPIGSQPLSKMFQKCSKMFPECSQNFHKNTKNDSNNVPCFPKKTKNDSTINKQKSNASKQILRGGQFPKCVLIFYTQYLLILNNLTIPPSTPFKGLTP